MGDVAVKIASILVRQNGLWEGSPRNYRFVIPAQAGIQLVFETTAGRRFEQGSRSF